MLKKPFLTLLLLAPLDAAIAQNANWQSQIWEGKIANFEIVLEAQRLIDDKGNVRIAAHYFYKKHRKVINLYPLKNGRDFKETEYDCIWATDEKCNSNGEFRFTKAGDFSKGVWVSGSKKQLQVSLKKVSQTEYKPKQKLNDFENFFYAYNISPNSIFYEKQVTGAYSSSKPISFGQYSIEYRTDSATKVAYPRILSFPNNAVKMKVNTALDANHKLLIGDALECASMPKNFPGQGTLGGFDEYSAQVKALESNFMTIEESASLFCGGAHPNNMWFHNVYDMRTGAKFDFSKHFRLFDTKEDKENYNYSMAFKDFMDKLPLQSKYFVDGADKEMFEECINSEVLPPYTLSLRKDGLSFEISDVPHVMGACMGEYFVVPYKDVSYLMTPEGLNFFAPYLK